MENKPLFENLWQIIERMRTKKRLKAAFRRKPRPAKVKIPDEDIPEK